jgi:hypothetical protein
MIEAGLAMIACCLPTLKPLITDRGIVSAVRSLRSAASFGRIYTNDTSLNAASDNKTSRSKTYNHIEDGSMDAVALRNAAVEMQMDNYPVDARH